MRGKAASSTSKPASTLILRLDAMMYGGDAIGRAEGKAIFVQGGIAGERVSVEIVEDRGRFARAKVVEILEASPHRVQPRCPHFGFDANSCGGCHWQHIDYPAQVRFKTEIVREQLRRLGHIDDAQVRDTIPSPQVWAYRNHAQFSVTPDGRLGFQAARSNRVVPIDECHVVQAPIAEWLTQNRRAHTGEGQVALRVDGGEEERKRRGERETRRTGERVTANFDILNSTFQVSRESFFQVNTSLIATLVDLAVGGLDLRGGESVLDAYCGVGLFSRFIAPVAGHVAGIESGPSAVADARVNLAPFGHVELHEGLVEDVLPGLLGSLDAAIVDPPRAGCGQKVIQTIIDKHVKRLVYVSCDPATLARDARQLIDGGYRLIEVQPVDMFPHTYHIESVSSFSRSGQTTL